MTFEELCYDLIGEVEKDAKGKYTGDCGTLADIVCDVLLVDPETYQLSWDEQEPIIAERLFRACPHLRKAEGSASEVLLGGGCNEH